MWASYLACTQTHLKNIRKEHWLSLLNVFVPSQLPLERLLSLVTHMQFAGTRLTTEYAPFLDRCLKEGEKSQVSSTISSILHGYWDKYDPTVVKFLVRYTLLSENLELAFQLSTAHADLLRDDIDSFIRSLVDSSLKHTETLRNYVQMCAVDLSLPVSEDVVELATEKLIEEAPKSSMASLLRKALKALKPKPVKK